MTAARTLDVLAGTGAGLREPDPGDAIAGVVPGCVAAPDTIEQAAGVLRAAAEHGLTVLPRGAGTKLDWGGPPAPVDVLVDTHGMDRILEHAAGDLVVAAQPGVTMEQLSARLATANQRLACDVPVPGSTVGGTLATGISGPLRLSHGTIRDLVIGMTVVRADGTVASSGGKVVKNVAGYDLGKLFTGSRGTLGLIVAAVFRLHPVPAARSWVSVRTGDAADAGRAIRAVVGAQLVPGAIELDRPAGSSIITVTVLLEGGGTDVAARAGQATELLGSDAQVSEQPPDGYGGYPDGPTLLTVTVPPAAIVTALTAIEAAGRDAERPAAVRGQAACGVLQVALGRDCGPLAVATFLAALRARLAEAGGGAVLLRAPALVRDAVDAWGPVPGLALMRRIKDEFDPDHRLAPGRFFDR